MRKWLFLMVCCVLPSLLRGQNTSILGTWKGTLDTGNGTLDLYCTFVETEAGLAATMSVPAQGAYGIAIDRVSFDGMNLSLEIDALVMKYRGMLLMGTVAGTFAQYGMELPLSFVRGELPKPKRPQEPQRPFPYEEKDVTFRNERDGHTLAGTLTLPQVADRAAGYDAIVLVSGSGAQNRDEELMGHKPFLLLADVLTRAGYAVLRYDDRGVGASGGVFETATTEDFANDARAAVAYLKQQPNVRRVGILGHSEGASVAFLIAADTASEATTCDFVISFAGPGVRGDEILLSQQRRIYTLSGVPSNQIEQQLAANRLIYDRVLAASANDEALRQELEMVVGNPEVVQQLLSPWMYAFIRFSPQEALRQIRVPVLAFNGTKDVQVIWDLNLPAIESALKEAGNTHVSIVPLEGLNHLGQTCQSGIPQEYAQIEETLASQVIDTILSFLAGL